MNMIDVSMGIVCLGIIAGLGRLIWKRKMETLRSSSAESPDIWEPAASGTGSSPVRRTRKKGAQGDSLRFAPELFEHRARAIEELESRGFSWMTNYSSIDCLHDVYGLEVCGIREREDAVRILDLLVPLFPTWRPG